MSPPRRSDQTYAEELATVLRAGEPARLREFLIRSAREFGDDEQVTQMEGQTPIEIESLMHRMILARRDLAELHAASKAWIAPRDQAGGRDAPRRPGQPARPSRRRGPTTSNRGSP